MTKKLNLTICALLVAFVGFAQQVDFEHYTLDNGLDVVLHQDNSAPLVKVEVMYNVGSKDDPTGKTGMAHFFEHLLFEGTKNIDRGDWFKMVTDHGGTNNANTSWDRTTYFEILPSNNLQIGLWMESERMRHPKIDTVGVNTQRGVIKEERKQTQDNQPYGNLISQITRNIFPTTGYRHEIIGTLEDLDNPELEDFNVFFDKFYAPNNAVLVVAGDIDIDQTKEWIDLYFSSIPQGEKIERKPFEEEPIEETIYATFHDPNIQIPALAMAYRTVPDGTKEAKALDMISQVLSSGKSSRLTRKLVEDKKMALAVQAGNFALRNGGMYFVFALPMEGYTLEDLKVEIDEEIERMQNELISENEYQKLLNQLETRFVNANSSVEGIGSSLAEFQTKFGDASLINKQLDMYREVTREDLQKAAKKYLNPNQRLVLDYLPAEDEQ